MNYEQLNAGQKQAYEAIMSGKDVFITGGAGTGKSFLLRIAKQDLETAGKKVIIGAPTAMAAYSVGGTTIHRIFDFRSTAAFSPKRLEIIKRVSKGMESVDVLFIDEISMCRMDIFDAIYASLNKLKEKKGKRPQLVVIGDFFQLPPVLRDDTGEKKLLERYYQRRIQWGYAFLSNSWSKFNFECVVLTEIIRQVDSAFADALNRIRIGDADAINYFESATSKVKIANAPNLYAYNNNVNQANMRELQRIPNEEVIFKTISEGITGDAADMDIPDELRIKRGCRVIITSNDIHGRYAENLSAIPEDLDWKARQELLDKGLYHNGSTGTVWEVIPDDDDWEKDEIVIMLDDGPLILLFRHRYDVTRYIVDLEKNVIRTEVLGTYHQFPVKPAYALTIHKGQGSTYDAVNLDPACITPGQLYVALSRVRDVSKMHLLRTILPEYLIVDPLVKEFYDHLSDEGYIYSWMRSGDHPDAESPAPVAPIQNDTDAVTKETISRPVEAEIDQAVPDQNATAKSTKSGRPARYPNGSKVVRIPAELDADISKVIDRICPKTGMNQNELKRFQELLKEFLVASGQK